MSQRPFRFGVINEHAHSAEAWVAQARRAEALGYATFLIRDHFAPDFFGDQLAPFTALMAAASMTTTLRVGTMVIDNDYRHPVVLAKEAATLDLLSGGRLELGLGAGWLRAEYDRAGLAFDPPGVRIDRLEESLGVLKALFTGRPVKFAGRHYTIDGLAGFPLPAQRPHPPILIGAGSPRMLRLAGREASIVGILGNSTRSGTLVDDARERLAASVEAKIASVREGAGPRFGEIELSTIVNVVPTDDSRREAERLMAARGWKGITVDDVLDMPTFAIGTVDEIVSALEARRERFGVTYHVVSDAALETFAPVVARLGGR